MSIINQLSSQTGDATENSNKLVAEGCIKNPQLLSEIAAGLAAKDKKLVADCAEVCTLVSAAHPELIAPYIQAIIPVLDHVYTKARWEAVHTIAQLAATNPTAVQPLLATLQRMALSDKSKVVQDYATTAIGNYGGSGKQAAIEALPLLARILEVEGDRQAVRVIDGMSKIVAADSTLGDKIRKATTVQASATKSSIKQAYKKLMKQLG